MPKALTIQGGESERIPIKVPRGMRELLKGVLTEKETISSLTRQLWDAEIARRFRPPARVKKAKRSNC